MRPKATLRHLGATQYDSLHAAVTPAKGEKSAKGDRANHPRRPAATTPASLGAARATNEHRVRRLAVVDSGGRLLGISSRRDLPRVFLRPDEAVAVAAAVQQAPGTSETS
jgi:CBS domain-containing protein